MRESLKLPKCPNGLDYGFQAGSNFGSHDSSVDYGLNPPGPSFGYIALTRLVRTLRQNNSKLEPLQARATPSYGGEV